MWHRTGKCIPRGCVTVSKDSSNASSKLIPYQYAHHQTYAVNKQHHTGNEPHSKFQPPSSSSPLLPAQKDHRTAEKPPPARDVSLFLPTIHNHRFDPPRLKIILQIGSSDKRVPRRRTGQRPAFIRLPCPRRFPPPVPEPDIPAKQWIPEPWIVDACRAGSGIWSDEDVGFCCCCCCFCVWADCHGLSSFVTSTETRKLQSKFDIVIISHSLPVPSPPLS